MGYLMLQGGSEFGGGMAASDRRAMDLAGGPHAAIRIIPAAAALDHNHQRAARNGIHWFRSLGAGEVAAVDLIDAASAADAAIAAELRRAKLIYMLGGFPGYLAETLAASPAWEAMCAALEDGAVLAGSSAGAMVMCEHLYDPRARKPVAGLGLIADACVIPHHNRFGGGWVAELQKNLPRAILIGIDEQTGIIGIGGTPPESWTVYGPGKVTLYRRGKIDVFQHGQSFGLVGRPLY